METFKSTKHEKTGKIYILNTSYMFPQFPYLHILMGQIWAKAQIFPIKISTYFVSSTPATILGENLFNSSTKYFQKNILLWDSNSSTLALMGVSRKKYLSSSTVWIELCSRHPSIKGISSSTIVYKYLVGQRPADLDVLWCLIPSINYSNVIMFMTSILLIIC